jgi:hypothetical protein
MDVVAGSGRADRLSKLGDVELGHAPCYEPVCGRR